MLRTKTRLQTRKAAARLLAAPHHLAPRTLHVDHVVELMQPAAPAYAVPIVPVTANDKETVLNGGGEGGERGGGGRRWGEEQEVTTTKFDTSTEGEFVW